MPPPGLVLFASVSAWNAFVVRAYRIVPGMRTAGLTVAQAEKLAPDSRIFVERVRRDGRILEAVRGTGGFGYDPIFFVDELGKTFAEMSLEEKRSVSHRGRALRKARHVLEEWYGFDSTD